MYTIKALFADEDARTENGLMKDTTADENIRYSGSNEVVRNYVEFGNTGELWRIIGIFEVDGAKRLKLVREDSIGYIAWDTSDSTVNSGYGINQWGSSVYLDATTGEETTTEYEGADLMQILNDEYLSKETAASACYTVSGDSVGSASDCNFSEIGMSATYKSMIAEVTWNTGAIDLTDTNIVNASTMAFNTVNWYSAERGSVNGKTCAGGNYCNDLVKRTTTWEGQVALPYASDYAYASSEEECYTNMNDGYDAATSSYANMTCKNSNWMHYGSTYTIEEATWMLSPIALPVGSSILSNVRGDGLVLGYFYANNPLRVRPTIYLDSNVQIIDGTGIGDDPYILSM